MTLYADSPSLDITSPTNSRIKWLVSLRKRRTREVEGVTMIEGHAELSLALAAGVEPRQLFYCPALVGDPQALLAQIDATATQVKSVSEAAFAKASYRESPDGWLAVVKDPMRRLDELTLNVQALVLVCESIEKPGNLGAMVRTAEAAGLDAVIAASPVADWGNPNTVRASKGTVFVVPVASAPTVEVISWLLDRRLRIVVATPDGDQLFTDTDLTGPSAIVVGAEHAGVTSTWLEVADDAARLPMRGHVNSLNVATSAAIAVYEALRQRT
ncbi:MAG: RNA methyltransferase [Nocardioidaceae bacterium]|nr:RNA methyltransferase [Nocardioidaceae bacterium]